MHERSPFSLHRLCTFVNIYIKTYSEISIWNTQIRQWQKQMANKIKYCVLETLRRFILVELNKFHLQQKF